MIMAEFSKVMAYNMGEDGWEVKKKKKYFPSCLRKVFSLIPSNLSHQLLQASLLLSFVRVWSFGSDSLLEGACFLWGFSPAACHSKTWQKCEFWISR